MPSNSTRAALMRLFQALVGLDGLVRIHALGFTLIWPVPAASSVAPLEIWPSALGLALICFSYNVYGYLLNNVIDLPVDRSHPRRAEQWLVTGAMSTRAAMALVAPQIPIMLVAHMLFGFPLSAWRWLFPAILLMTIYDLWGKRCSIPPIMDGTLAMSGVTLTAYGVATTGHAMNAQAWCVALSSGLYLLMINAFHNDLRDIDNDSATGQRTTATYFGSRGSFEGRVHIPRAMVLYGATLQALLVALAAAAWWLAGSAASVGFAVFLTSLLNVCLFIPLVRAREPVWERVRYIHIFTLPLPLVAALADPLDGRIAALLAIAYLLPLGLLPPGQKFVHLVLNGDYGRLRV